MVRDQQKNTGNSANKKRAAIAAELEEFDSWKYSESKDLKTEMPLRPPGHYKCSNPDCGLTYTDVNKASCIYISRDHQVIFVPDGVQTESSFTDFEMNGVCVFPAFQFFKFIYLFV